MSTFRNIIARRGFSAPAVEPTKDLTDPIPAAEPIEDDAQSRHKAINEPRYSEDLPKWEMERPRETMGTSVTHAPEDSDAAGEEEPDAPMTLAPRHRIWDVDAKVDSAASRPVSAQANDVPVASLPNPAVAMRRPSAPLTRLVQPFATGLPDVISADAQAPQDIAPQDIAPQVVAPQVVAPQDIAPQVTAPANMAPQAAAPAPAALPLRSPISDMPAPARGGRVKTRLLGFHSDDVVPDAFAATPAPAATAAMKCPVGWLVIVDGPGLGNSFALSSGLSMIGRGTDQTIALDFGDNSISRENHASIAYDEEENTVLIGHGGKSNLVRLNGKPLLTTTELSNADHIRIGKTTLRYVALCGPDFSWPAATDDADGGVYCG